MYAVYLLHLRRKGEEHDYKREENRSYRKVC